MQRKCMIWFVVFAIVAGICYWGWHRADNYCMYDRMTKETKILHELEVRDVVFAPITYNEHMYILDVKVPSYKIWDICEEETTLYGERLSEN